MTDAKNRKLRQALAKRWQDQPRKPDYSHPVTIAGHGVVEPTDAKLLSLRAPIELAFSEPDEARS